MTTINEQTRKQQRLAATCRQKQERRPISPETHLGLIKKWA